MTARELYFTSCKYCCIRLRFAIMTNMFYIIELSLCTSEAGWLESLSCYHGDIDCLFFKVRDILRDWGRAALPCLGPGWGHQVWTWMLLRLRLRLRRGRTGSIRCQCVRGTGGGSCEHTFRHPQYNAIPIIELSPGMEGSFERWCIRRKLHMLIDRSLNQSYCLAMA